MLKLILKLFQNVWIFRAECLSITGDIIAVKNNICMKKQSLTFKSAQKIYDVYSITSKKASNS